MEHPAQITRQKAEWNCEAYVRTQVNVHEVSHICIYLLGLWATKQPEMTSKLSQAWPSGTEGQSKIPKACRSFISELKSTTPPSNCYDKKVRDVGNHILVRHSQFDMDASSCMIACAMYDSSPIFQSRALDLNSYVTYVTETSHGKPLLVWCLNEVWSTTSALETQWRSKLRRCPAGILATPRIVTVPWHFEML